MADRRVRYTHLILRQTLLEMMKTSPIDKISVKGLCERADINRATFYTYYRTPRDLLFHIEEDLLREINASLKEYSASPVIDVLRRLFALIWENRDLCAIVFGEYGDKEYLGRIIFAAHDWCVADWKDKYPLLPPEYFDQAFAYNAGGIVSLIEIWVKEGLRMPPETFADIVSALVGDEASVKAMEEAWKAGKIRMDEN